MATDSEPLRVALVAGSLTNGGAEKQLVYIAKALAEAGVEVQVYCVTRGEFHQTSLAAMGLEPIWFGQRRNPLLRIGTLVRQLRAFRPHVIHSTHFFANIYAAIAGSLLRTMSIGAVRSSLAHCQEKMGRWVWLLLQTPTALIVNSNAAIDSLTQQDFVRRDRLFYLPNAVALPSASQNGASAATISSSPRQNCRAIFVGRLIAAKRLDRFIDAFSRARRQEPKLLATVVGDGPERSAMECSVAASELDGFEFLGERSDVANLLNDSQMLVLSSDEEGLPNVVLEAMAAGLPVISTPAGDVPRLIEDGVHGFMVGFQDVDGMADCMVRLARDPELCRELGHNGRRCVEERYAFDRLSAKLLDIYRSVASMVDKQRVLSALEQYGQAG